MQTRELSKSQIEVPAKHARCSPGAFGVSQRCAGELPGLQRAYQRVTGVAVKAIKPDRGAPAVLPDQLRTPSMLDGRNGGGMPNATQ